MTAVCSGMRGGIVDVKRSAGHRDAAFVVMISLWFGNETFEHVHIKPSPHQPEIELLRRREMQKPEALARPLRIACIWLPLRQRAPRQSFAYIGGAFVKRHIASGLSTSIGNQPQSSFTARPAAHATKAWRFDVTRPGPLHHLARFSDKMWR